MALQVSIFLAVSLSVSFLYGSGASGHIALENWPRHWEGGGGPPKENEQRPLPEVQDRRQKSLDPSKSLKVLDFSADVDYQPDDDGEYTRAFSDFGALPESFTICSAFMVEAWYGFGTSAHMFSIPLPHEDDDLMVTSWAYVHIHAAFGYRQYYVKAGNLFFGEKDLEAAFFPQTWSHVCYALDSSKLRLVVDGKVMAEKEYNREKDTKRPTNMFIRLGFDGGNIKFEYEGRVGEVNIFKSALSNERMMAQTTAGGEECGAPGDLVNWEEAEWTLHSQHPDPDLLMVCASSWSRAPLVL